MKWIKLEDRMPEIHEYRPGSGTGCSDPILVYLDGETENGTNFDVWRMYRGGRGDTTSIHWDWDHANVTHWAPLTPPTDVANKFESTIVFEVSSNSPIPYKYVDSLSSNPRLVCIGEQTDQMSINLENVAAVLVDIQDVGDGLQSKKYAHVRVLNTPKGELLASLDSLSLKAHFSNFRFMDGYDQPVYIQIVPKIQ